MSMPNPPVLRAGLSSLKGVLFVALITFLLFAGWSLAMSQRTPPTAISDEEPATAPVAYSASPGVVIPAGPAKTGLAGQRSFNGVLSSAVMPDLFHDRGYQYSGVEGLEPNELGNVMILMYHSIGTPEGTWQRTPDNFRGDLQRLYDLGYRAVGLTDYLSGHIDIPAGTSPVVLTFDDGTMGQFRLIEEPDGKTQIDPDSAVGILVEFARQHPDFGLEATFFVNGYAPFGQPKYWREKVHMLVQLGMELGNHTYAHVSLQNASAEEIQAQLARWVDRIREVLPGYNAHALALPFGQYPRLASRDLLLEGISEGTSYRNQAVLMVGARPAPSPFAPNFGPFLPRVRADQERLDEWLGYFQDHPEKRYVSDGIPGKVTGVTADESDK